MQTTTTNAAAVDATFDEIFNSYLCDASFDANEVTGSFTAAGVAVEEAVEKHFAASCAGDDDWSMV